MYDLTYEKFVTEAFNGGNLYDGTKGKDPAKLADTTNITISKMKSATAYAMWIHNNNNFINNPTAYNKGEAIIDDVLAAKEMDEISSLIKTYITLLSK